MKVAVIINKSAGSAKAEKNERFIKKAFDELKVQCEVHITEGSEIQNSVKQIVEKGVDVLVAAGGDGTVNTVAGILAGGNVPLGVLPCGTLNHFAKDLGIPLDLNEAVKVISDGNIKMIDIAEVNGRKFINNSSIGLYPQIVKKRVTKQKQFVRKKWAAMLFAVISVFKKFPLYNIEIKVKDKLVKLSTTIVFVGNNKYKSEFFNPGIRDRLDEGILSLCVPRCHTRFCLVRLSFLSLVNKMEQDKDFEVYYTTEVTLNTPKKKIDVAYDGEVLRMSSPLSYKIIPESLPVVVPVSK